GYDEKDVVGEPVTILMPEHYRDIHSRKIKSFEGSENGGKTYESQGLRKDGSEFPVEISVTAWKIGKEKFFTCILRDITKRKKAMGKIKEQAALLDKARNAILVHDLEYRLIYWNKGAQSLYGWTEEEVMGKNANELLHQDGTSALIEAKNRVIDKGEWEGELRQRTRDGNEIIVESRWSLVSDGEDKPESILVINTDVTEKKKLESQLLRAQRMESIGTLSSGIAHDLNNILTPMMLSLQLLKEKFKDEQSQKLLTILEQNSQRGADLIKQVLSFSRGVEGERNPLSAKHLLAEIERIIKETFPRNIEITIDIQNDLFIISGDVTQLHQVIMNLCVNARDAMPDGGILSISAENFFIDENQVRMHAWEKPGFYIAVEVSDTGTGIPSRIIDRIFDPFFTTKEIGKGTGLGLSTALAIVKSHGGFIDVQSAIGKGTTFKVYLPALSITEKQEAPQRPAELIRGNGETILVIDDEMSIRETTCAILEKCGYKAIAACDGIEAIMQYTKNKEEVKIVLIDMSMPIMDGPACIHALLKIDPDIKIIAVSGLIEEEMFSKIKKSAVDILRKPYTAEDLLERIHKVMIEK
ncbi:MAG TPA: PAS domain S-box protein, partial [Candidatus Methanoperedens sp.]